jgi:hypothetical protein
VTGWCGLNGRVGGILIRRQQGGGIVRGQFVLYSGCAGRAGLFDCGLAGRGVAGVECEVLLKKGEEQGLWDDDRRLR